MNKIWKLKYEHGTWVVLYHPKDGEYTELNSTDLANLYTNKPTVTDMLAWEDDLIERYLDLGDYSEAAHYIEKYRLPCKK